MTKDEGVETSDIVIDEKDGVFGHRISMLDFSPADLVRFRRIGEIVEVKGPQGVAEGALALSGSAAQSKIQTHPGDADFFQRLNIRAGTRDEACSILATLMKEHVLSHEKRADLPVHRGEGGSSFAFDCVHRGEPQKKGGPISVEARRGQGRGDGGPRSTAVRSPSDWDAVATRAGLVQAGLGGRRPGPEAAHQRQQCHRRDLGVFRVATSCRWTATSTPTSRRSTSTPGQLPTFTKVVQHVSGNALDDYVDQLEGEVRKYLAADHANYGKAAKRMYNVFRLTGRHARCGVPA